MNGPVNRWQIAAKLFALLAIFALSAAGARLVPHEVPLAAPLAALGLLLLGGELLAELMERFGLPHLTGYLLAGISLGPHGFGLVSAATVEQLSPINALALALIALSAGGEMTVGLLRSSARSLAAATLTQVLLALPIVAVGFGLMAGSTSFLAGAETGTIVAAALLWAVLAISRSPAATLGLIAQLKPRGPLTSYALAVVVAFDIVVLLIFSVAIQLARSLADGAAMQWSALEMVGTELLGSIAAGTTLGLVITACLKLVRRQLILFLLVVAYGMAEFAAFFGYDSLLMFVVAGLVVANVSPRGGEVLLESTSLGGRVAYVIFFAVAGAHLDLPLLAEVWPVAVGLVLVRLAATWLAARVGSWLAHDVPAVARFGWMPLVSQAGVTIGMAVVVGNAFPNSFGPSLQALAVAVVGINELVGPILFKFALDRTGETGRGDEAVPAAGQAPEPPREEAAPPVAAG